MPGEAEKAAKLLGVPFGQFKQRLIKNYWRDEETDPMVWQPRKVGTEEEVASDRYTRTPGRCTFLTANDRCEIHAAKPYECRQAVLCEKNIDVWPEVNRVWKESGEKI